MNLEHYHDAIEHVPFDPALEEKILARVAARGPQTRRAVPCRGKASPPPRTPWMEPAAPSKRGASSSPCGTVPPST